MAKRFDRWFASPASIALPQAFDEFLSLEELPCLVDGCSWVGTHLTSHMNFAHGVPKDEFKRAAGFNLSTGVISAGLQERFRGRTPHGRLFTEDERRLGLAWAPTRNYHSLEAREHMKKAIAIADGPGPQRVCRGCGLDFTQSSVFGLTKFCSLPCRDQFYAKEARAAVYPCVCAVCQNPFNGVRAQDLRRLRSLPVVCGHTCKGKLNGSRPKPKRRRG